MRNLDEMVSRYEAVPVPKGFRHDLSENVDAVQTDFFLEIITALDLGHQALGYFDVRDRMLLPITHSQLRRPGSDDYLHELLLGNAQTLALTLRTRDQFNYEVAHFSKIPLQQTTLDWIQSLEAGETDL